MHNLPHSGQGVLGSPVGGNLQKDLVWLFVGIHTLSHQPSGWLHNPRPRAKSSPASMIYLLIQLGHAERCITTPELHQFHS
ncbi:hypothetical protein DFAR_2810029 [Desulfarculales bacterium]